MKLYCIFLLKLVRTEAMKLDLFNFTVSCVWVLRFQNCAILNLGVKENEFWFIIGWESH